MMQPHAKDAQPKGWSSVLFAYFWMTLGAFLAAFALKIFFFPNKLIDGGIVGIAMLGAYTLGQHWFAPLMLTLSLPFVWLAYRYIGKTFVLHMLYSLLMFSAFSTLIKYFGSEWEFKGETLEYIVIGGSLLGIGLGMIIRYGGSLDGTEILGIIINKRTGFTVGQVVLATNIFIFAFAGLILQDWHPPLLSLITYIVVIKIMDAVIVGLDEVKSVLIISSNSKEIAQAIMHELELGLTIMYGRGGYSGDEREIIYVIVERLQLCDLKELIYAADPQAFIAIENIHEVANGNQGPPKKGGTIRRVLTSLIGGGNSDNTNKAASQ
jgi:uncharacterized membrane-anchored protein YitT (DUF2179 family)